jgi:mevalonate kinase
VLKVAKEELTITPETELDMDKKELAKVLRRFKEHTEKFATESFLKISGTPKNLQVSIADNNKQTIEAIIEQNSTLDFCAAGDMAKIREYLNFFKVAHPVIESASLGRTWISKFCPEPAFDGRPQFFMTIGSNGFQVALEILDLNERAVSVLETLKSEFSDSFELTYRTSGKANQHAKVIYNIDHKNYEAFKDEAWKVEVLEKIKEFYKECDNILDKHK